jgi:Type VI secretion, TssG/PASTA domain
MALLRMPDLAHAERGFHHTVDSALETFAELGVSPHRITLRMAGRGMPSRQVVSQSPAAGAELQPGDTIVLDIAGTGYWHNLPTAFRDTGGESVAGTQEILSPIDDPYQKAAHWLREGARLFDISPRNPDACARWMALFGLSSAHWPQDSWHNLAILLPSLQALAGKEYGMRFALHHMLGLGLDSIRRRPGFRYLDDGQLSLLTERMSRLGVDTVLGDRIEDVARIEIVIGPVSVAQYYGFQQGPLKSMLESVLYLIVPCHQRYAVNWSVADRARAPRLGQEEMNSRLGLNSYLGVSAA